MEVLDQKITIYFHFSTNNSTRMKNQYLYIFAFLFLFQNINAQDFEKTKGSLGVYVMPISLIYFHPRLQVGLEYRTKKDLAFNIDFAFGTPPLKNKNRYPWTNNYSFFSIQPEIKIFTKQQADVSSYFAIELFYMIVNDEFENNSYIKEDNTQINYEKATYNKQKLGVHIKRGYKLMLLPQLELDFFAGMGFAFKRKFYSDVILSGIPSFPASGWIWKGYRHEVNKVGFHVTLGLKLGWRFNIQ